MFILIQCKNGFSRKEIISRQRPLDTIRRLLDVASYPVIVKEVGQGMGIESLKALLKLPLAAIDFGANGGTNFALLELLRSDDVWMEELGALARVGHSAEEMVEMTNFLKEELKSEQLCHEIIISGGITNFLDGYYLLKKCQLNSVYGQASAFLKYAMGNYDQLHKFVETQVKGLSMARNLLKGQVIHAVCKNRLQDFRSSPREKNYNGS